MLFLPWPVKFRILASFQTIQCQLVVRVEVSFNIKGKAQHQRYKIPNVDAEVGLLLCGCLYVFITLFYRINEIKFVSKVYNSF